MILRVARHTNQLEKIKEFYTSILEFELIGEFNNHDQYDGIFLGKKGCDWHLEFTQNNIPATHNFDPEDLLVIYPRTEDEYTSIISKIEQLKIPKLQPTNPYWAKNGLLIHDPDDYGIIICNLKIA